MDSMDKTTGKVDLGASPGVEGWKDVLQLLEEQSEKMEKLSRALSVIQQGMKMAPEKTEALLVTDKRSFQNPKIVFGEREIE